MFIATAVAAIVAAPLFEEFLFRVLLQGWFESIEARRRVLRLGLPGEGSAWWPIVLSSIHLACDALDQRLGGDPALLLWTGAGLSLSANAPNLAVAHNALLAQRHDMIVVWIQVRHAAT